MKQLTFNNIFTSFCNSAEHLSLSLQKIKLMIKKCVYNSSLSPKAYEEQKKSKQEEDFPDSSALQCLPVIKKTSSGKARCKNK